jgi:hypothetical protein
MQVAGSDPYYFGAALDVILGAFPVIAALITRVAFLRRRRSHGEACIAAVGVALASIIFGIFVSVLWAAPFL